MKNRKLNIKQISKENIKLAKTCLTRINEINELTKTMFENFKLEIELKKKGYTLSQSFDNKISLNKIKYTKPAKLNQAVKIEDY